MSVTLEPIIQYRGPRRNPDGPVYTGGFLSTGERDTFVFAEGGPSLPLLPQPNLSRLLPPKAREYVEGIFNGEVDKTGQGQAREELAEGILSLVGPKRYIKAILTLLGSETPTGSGADPPRVEPPGPHNTPRAEPWTYAITQALARVRDQVRRRPRDAVGQFTDSAFLDLLASLLPPDP